MVKFHVGRLEISVTFGFLLVLSLLSVTGSLSLGFTAIASCIIHELGHCFASVILNVKIKSLTLWAGGVQIERESRIISIGAELAVLISGPLFNLISAIFYLLFGFNDAAMVNLTLAIFNLLPYSSLDGGCMIKAVLERKSLNVHIIQKVIAVSFGIIILIALFLTRNHNITADATILLLTADELFSEFTDSIQKKTDSTK